MSAARPEFGPSLPEVVGPRLRRLPRPARLALGLLVGLIVVLVAIRLVGGAGDDRVAVLYGDAPQPFTLAYDPRMERVATTGSEQLRLESEGTVFSVSPLALAPYAGDSAATLPVVAEGLVGQMAGQYPEFVRRSDGRANVNRQQGHQIFFQFRRDGQLWYGRRVLLLPTPTSREGADILLLSQRTPAISQVDAVGQNGLSKVALRSFRFGTERP